MVYVSTHGCKWLLKFKIEKVTHKMQIVFNYNFWKNCHTTSSMKTSRSISSRVSPFEFCIVHIILKVFLFNFHITFHSFSRWTKTKFLSAQKNRRESQRETKIKNSTNNEKESHEPCRGNTFSKLMRPTRSEVWMVVDPSVLPDSWLKRPRREQAPRLSTA